MSQPLRGCDDSRSLKPKSREFVDEHKLVMLQRGQASWRTRQRGAPRSCPTKPRSCLRAAQSIGVRNNSSCNQAERPNGHGNTPLPTHAQQSLGARAASIACQLQSVVTTTRRKGPQNRGSQTCHSWPEGRIQTARWNTKHLMVKRRGNSIDRPPSLSIVRSL